MIANRLLLRIRGLMFRERPAEEVPEDDLAKIDVSWSVAAGLGTKNIIVAPLFQTKNLRLALRAGEPLRVVRPRPGGGLQRQRRPPRLETHADPL